MAVNANKTKFIVFRTRGKIINPQDCHLVFNSNEIGQPEDPERIYEIERIYNDGPTKSFKLLGVLFDEYLQCCQVVARVHGYIFLKPRPLWDGSPQNFSLIRPVF